jgi:5'-3' exonuclease
MLAFIEVTLNLFVLGGILLAAAAFGFVIKSGKLGRQSSNIEKLEKEMLSSHAEILRLQKELAIIDNQTAQAPIVSIRDNASDSNKESLPDAAMRKKVFSGIGKAKP